MSNGDDKKTNERAEQLLALYFEGMLDESCLLELDTLLLTSESIRKRYLELVAISEGLLIWASETHSEETKLEFLRNSIEPQPVEPDRHRSMLFPGGNNSPIGICVVAFVALVLIGIVYLGFGRLINNLPPDVVGNPAPLQQRGTASADELEFYVARLSEVSENAMWGKQRPSEFLFRFRKNEILELTQGTASIEFNAGAKLVLFGPTKVEILNTDAASLLNGRVRGYAENGNFRLITSSAEIVDLGTEFGVSIDDSANVIVSVFEGSVDVSGFTNLSSKPAPPVLLKAGKGVRVSSNGVIANSSAETKKDFEWIVREPVANAMTPGEISLVDIISGGDGNRDRVAGSIDPRTGGIDTSPEPKNARDRRRYGDRQLQGSMFHKSVTSEFLDGTFIPNNDANITVNSNGDMFNFGFNRGVTWGPIWARKHVSGLVRIDEASNYWGPTTYTNIVKALETSKFGVVGLHANVGITFDLQAAREFHGEKLEKFTAVLMNLDDSKAKDPTRREIDTADFRVLVDGQVRFEKLGFSLEDGRIKIDVGLKNSDRFLTLVSTDGGNSISYDHVVLIDPVLLER